MLFPPEEIWRATTVETPAAEVAKILLVGWEGTLAPHSAGPQATPLPVEVTAIVEPLVLEAMNAVRTELCGLGLQGTADARSLERLAPALQRRLGSLYALPVALGRMHLSTPERAGADRLARLLAQDWVTGVELFLMRLKIDSKRIARWMGAQALPLILSLRTAASDIHGRGGAVIEIEFAGGGRIFYKPRPVTGELLWAELNAAVAAADPGARVTSASVLADGPDGRSSYGWMETLARGSCDAGEHWHRAGALLCMAQHAGMSDLHMANVMATAGGPAVLDAECLGDPARLGKAANEAAEQMLATGLLPVGRGAGAELLPDVSGLFGAGAGVRGVLVPQWMSSPDGSAMASFAAGKLLEQGNRHASIRAPLACLPEMLEGYLRCARALNSIRDDLLAEGGWVDRVDRLHCPRVVLRDTLSYGWMMSRSLFTGVIGSDASRRAALRQMLVDTPYALPLRDDVGIGEAEVEALLRLRVPRFHIASGTCDVACDEGRLLAREAVPCTPAMGIRRRLKAVSEDGFEVDATSALSAILFRSRTVEGSGSG